MKSDPSDRGAGLASVAIVIMAGAGAARTTFQRINLTHQWFVCPTISSSDRILPEIAATMAGGSRPWWIGGIVNVVEKGEKPA